MGLPKLSAVPKYTAEIPSMKKEVTFRPFLVKEEKVMLIALESQDANQIARSIIDTIESCIYDEINRKALTSYDVEYLFLQIRAKSVGEKTNLKFKCRKCEAENEVSVDINDIKLTKGEITNEIVLTDTINLEMRHPSYDSIIKNEKFLASTQTEQIFGLVKETVAAVITNDERIDISEVSDAEFSEFLESMTQAQFTKIRNYVETVPKLTYDIDFNCSDCGTKNELTVEGLQSFLS
tara:strand:- start:1356 stop:2066 length:711 start_codon:yes stop_codon:yes gene_type:complete